MASVCKATDVSTHEKLRELITLTNLMRADIKEAASCYRPIFNRVLHYPYFDPNYKLLERKVSYLVNLPGCWSQTKECLCGNITICTYNIL